MTSAEHQRQDLTTEALEPLRSLPRPGLRHGCSGGGHQPASSIRFPPSMPRPTSSTGASGAYSPVIRPS